MSAPLVALAIQLSLSAMPRADLFPGFELAMTEDPTRLNPLRVKGGGEAGIAAQLAPGHTPGHTAWRIETGGEPVLAWGDVVHVAALHLARPETTMVYDLDPPTATATRKALLDWAAESGALVASAHLAAPGLGRIRRASDRYVYQPLT